MCAVVPHHLFAALHASHLLGKENPYGSPLHPLRCKFVYVNRILISYYHFFYIYINHDINICETDVSKQGKTEALQINVPSALKRQLAMEAAKNGTTIRVLILRALAVAGFNIEQHELRDKRKG